MRTGWLSVALSVSAHGAAVVAFAFLLGPRVTGTSEGRALRVELPPAPVLAPLPEEAVENVEPVDDPDLAELVEPRLPDAERMTPKPLPSNEVLPPCPDDLCEPLMLAEVPVRVANLRTEPPPLAPTPKPRPSSPIVSAPRRAASPVPLVPVHRPRQYPPEAYRAGLEGKAKVEITIDAGGRVAHARLQTSSGHAVLDRAALASAKQWRFRPPGRARRAVIPFTYDIP